MTENPYLLVEDVRARVPRGGAANEQCPVDQYAEVEDSKNVKKLKAADAQWCVDVDGNPRIVGTYKRGGRAGRCSTSTRR